MAVKRRFTIFKFLCFALLLICTVLVLIPFILLVISSLTEESQIIKFGYSFFPKAWSLDAYKYLFEQGGQIIHAYYVSIVVTIIGTAVGVSITLMMGYSLSRPNLPGRQFFNFLVFFTILFNGGLVPSYIMWTTVFHIKDTLYAQIIPNLLLRGFYVILARSYFQSSIPESVIESAKIDGSGDIRTFISIVLPLSRPIISTLTLFIGLGYWNDWNNGLIFITKPKLYTIQNVLNDMIKNLQFLEQNSSFVPTIKLPSGTVRMAIAVIGVLPVLALYPFLQRGFVKGIVLGSVKG